MTGSPVKLIGESGVVVFDGTMEPPGGGGSQTVQIKRLAFAFDDAGLTIGLPVYTFSPGEWLIGLWVIVKTAWDGMTPQIDCGSQDGGTYGCFNLGGGTIDASVEWGNSTAFQTAREGGGTAFAGSPGGLSAVTGPWRGEHEVPPLLFTGPETLIVWVSQNGQSYGDDPESTHGDGEVVLLVGTPS